MIPIFNSEAEVINYAKVNGYDVGGTAKLLATWKVKQIKQAELESLVAVPKPIKSKKD
jgi:hypothetical protein